MTKLSAQQIEALKSYAAGEPGKSKWHMTRKSLRARGLIEVNSRNQVTLTEEGRKAISV